MKHLALLTLAALLPLALVSCGKNGEESAADSDWKPENASVARHITSVHGFEISPAENAHLNVVIAEGEITCTFREDVLETLGSEKALYILGATGNPNVFSRHDYLFFLDALHAYLVLNAPQWDGGEGKPGGGVLMLPGDT